jgi:glycine/D-amino acid oxidase-like deaminating enzyme
VTPVPGEVRPTATRRSWWLREALAAEAAAAPHLARAAPPLRGSTTADVVIVGGGYTGLWTALRLTELEPGARVVLLEQDICGGGPSGRNGGFVTNWWDEFPTLIDRYGAAGAIEVATVIEAAVDEVGAFCAANDVGAWYTKAGTVSASAAPAQDGGWLPAVAALREHGLGDRLMPLDADAVRARVDSPVFRDGVFMPGAATVQPAALTRGLRRVLLERGVTIHETTSAVEIDGQRPGWLGGLGAGTRRAPPRRGVAGGTRPVRVRTASAAGEGEVLAGSAVLALNAWAAAWPWFGSRLVTWSSYIVLTEPIPDRLADIGWTGGEGVTDARFTLHYLRTTPDGRIAIGGGGGRAGFAGRIGRAFTDSAADARRAAAGLRRLFPSLRDVRIEDALGRPDRHQRGPSAVVRVGRGPAHPLRSRVQRQRRRAVRRRGPDPRGPGGGACGRPCPEAGTGRRASTTAVPTGARQLPRRATDPRGGRAARDDRGTWRGPGFRPSRGQSAAPAVGLPHRARVGPGDRSRRAGIGQIGYR